MKLRSPSLHRVCLSVALIQHACLATVAFTPFMAAHAGESPPREPLSRVEIMAVDAVRTTTEKVLEVQGVGGPNQRLQLLQNDMVFFEQTLPEGEFKLKSIYPLNSVNPVKVKLLTGDTETENADLPLRNQRKVTLFNQRFELANLAPISRRTPKFDPSNMINEEDIEFDGDFLRGNSFRNLSAKDIKKLGTVRAGTYDADVFRNGEFITKTSLLFTEIPPGTLARACISPALFNMLGVKTQYISTLGLQSLQTAEIQKTSSKPQSTGAATKCLYINDWVASSSDKFDSGELRYDINIPQAFLSRSSRQVVPKELLTRGTNAAFINYNFNNFQSQNVNSNYLAFNTGLNIEGWQFRQSSSLSQSDRGPRHYVVGETVLKRPLIEQRANLVIGDTATESPVVGGVPIRGVRVSSEEALQPLEEREFRPVVRGVARTNARVRVSQNNAIIFEQNVPPGPFEFNELNPISSVGNLQVLVSEADGSEQRYLVPFSISAGKLNPGSYRYSVATGLYRNFSTTQDTQVVQGYVRYGINHLITPTVDVLAGPNYRNLGLQTSFNTSMGGISFNALFSHLYGSTPKTGQAYGVNYVAPAWRNINLYAGTNYQTQFYTTPSSGLGIANNGSQVVFESFKRSDFVSLGIGLAELGSIGLGWVEQTGWGDALSSRQIRLGYGVTVRRVSLYASVNRTSYGDDRPNIDSVNLSASVPLNFGSWNGLVRASADQVGNNSPTTGLAYYSSNNASEHSFSYGLNTTQTDGVSSSGAFASFLHPYGNVSASVTAGSGTHQTGLGLSGGLVAHNAGLTLAPALGDTFAIVEVPNGQGAGLLGSSAQVNSAGFGVVPSLSPYYLNDVQISMESAPMGLEIDNPTQKVAPVSGSIVKLKYKSSSGRPVAITFSLPDGDRFPIGTSVLDKFGNEIATLGQGNRALVRLQSDEGTLQLVWGDAPNMQCVTNYKLDKLPHLTTKNASDFERLKLICYKQSGTKAALNQVGEPIKTQP